MGDVGILCGMVSEVRSLGTWARDPRVSVAVSGARPDRATELASRFADDGVRLLISWGIAGALAPSLRPGDLILPDAVVVAGKTLPLAAGMLDGREGHLLGVDGVVMSVAEKTALHDQTGAMAIDMETHRLALVARDAGIPCLAVRAISDPAGRALPECAARALSPDGRPLVGAVLAGLCRRPADLPRLIAAGRDSTRALSALRRAADPIMGRVLAEG